MGNFGLREEVETHVSNELRWDILESYQKIRAVFEKKGRDYFEDYVKANEYLKDSPKEQNEVLVLVDQILSNQVPSTNDIEKIARALSSWYLEYFFSEPQSDGRSIGKEARNLLNRIEIPKDILDLYQEIQTAFQEKGRVYFENFVKGYELKKQNEFLDLVDRVLFARIPTIVGMRKIAEAINSGPLENLYSKLQVNGRSIGSIARDLLEKIRKQKPDGNDMIEVYKSQTRVGLEQLGSELEA